MKITLRQIRVGVLILTLMTLSGGIGWRLGQTHVSGQNLTQVLVNRNQPANKSQLDMSLYWQVWDKLNESYLIKNDLKPQEMIWGAIKGMTAALGDPYTVFLPPKQNKATQEELNGSFEGVGIQLGFKDNNLAVIAPLSGTPAETAGIRAGDYILHLKDEKKGIDVDTIDMSLPEAVEIIRGAKGTKIELTILHEGETEPVKISVNRDTIVIKSVEVVWPGEGKKVAHLKLSRFGGLTETEWDKAVKEIVKAKPKGIILDLRNNPGGYLQGAVRYAGEFLKRGLVVVKQEDAKGKIETYSIDMEGKLLDYPLVVLINEGSASSSEILAGALRDHGRAKLIGDKSFGKGTVQEALDLGEKGAGLHVTTAKWLLPSGEWVNQTKGLQPDIEVKNDLKEPDKDAQLQKALEVVLK